MSISLRKPASTLLTVLLILTALAAITLFATRRALTSTRSVSQLDNLQLATQMAQAGIDEGLLQVKNGTFTKITDTNSSYDQPEYQYRGFTDGTETCNAYETTKEARSSSCPSYDFVVRDYYRINAGNSEKFGISDLDLPLNKTITMQATGTGSLSFTPSTSFECSPATCQFSDSNPIRITRTGTGTSNITTIGTIAIQRPALIIEAIGYAGGVQKKLLFTLPRYEGAQGVLTDFGGTFDSDGFLK